MKNAFKNILLAILIGGVSFFAACKKDPNADMPGTGQIARAMFINAAVDSFKIRINDTLQLSVPAITFLTNSGYKNIRAGDIKTTFYLPSSDSVFAESNHSLTPFSFYSFFLGGSRVDANVIVSADDLTAPTTGKVKIRFANMSIDTAGMDCYIGDDKLKSTISNNVVTPFQEIEPVSDITIRMNNSTDTSKIEMTNQTLTPGKIYTVMLTGRRNGENNDALRLTMIANN